MDVTLNPTLMLDFTCRVEGIPTTNVTRDQVEVHYLPHKSNIAEDVKDDTEMPAAPPDTSAEQQTADARSSKAPAPTGDEQQLSAQHMWRLEALMSKENKALILMKVGTEEASTCFDAPASQDQASYDGDMSTSKWSPMK